MKRRKCPSLFMMWIRLLSLSDVRMLTWLSVGMPTGRNDFRGVEGRPVYLKRSLPVVLTSTTAQALQLPMQISKFMFSLKYSIYQMNSSAYLGIPLNVLFLDAARVTQDFCLFTIITFITFTIIIHFHDKQEVPLGRTTQTERCPCSQKPSP